MVRKAAPCPIVVAPELADQSISLSLKAVTAACLKWVEELADVTVSYVHGGVYIGKHAVRGRPTTKLYAVADLTMAIQDFPAPDLAQVKSGKAFNLWGEQPEASQAQRWDIDELAEIVERHARSR